MLWPHLGWDCPGLVHRGLYLKSAVGNVATASLSQGCSRASPCPPSTLKSSSLIHVSHLQAPPARKDKGEPQLLHQAPSGVGTTVLPGLGAPLLSLPTKLTSVSELPGEERTCYRSPMLTPRNPGATVSGSSSMRSYTLTQTVRLLSHSCSLALEPECLFIGAFPSNEVWDKRAHFPGHERCGREVTAVRWPRVSRCLLRERPYPYDQGRFNLPTAITSAAIYYSFSMAP